MSCELREHTARNSRQAVVTAQDVKVVDGANRFVTVLAGNKKTKPIPPETSQGSALASGYRMKRVTDRRLGERASAGHRTDE